MTTPIHFTVPGPPVAKERARMNRKTGAVYTPKKTAEYEARVAGIARKIMGVRKPIDGPIMLNVIAFFPIPKSWPKWKREAAHYHTTKPDFDNVAKAPADAMKGIVYRDDALVCDGFVRKLYDPNPRVEITIQEMPEIKRE